MSYLPILTENILYGYDPIDEKSFRSIIPISVSDIGIIERRVDPMNLEPEIFEVYPSYLYIGLKDSPESSLRSSVIYDEKFWSELREFALRKGISYRITANIFPKPAVYKGGFVWDPSTPVFHPHNIIDYDDSDLIRQCNGLNLYTEYRSLAGQTDVIEVNDYYLNKDPSYRLAFINKVKQVIPELTEKEFKRLFNQKDDGEKDTREVKK